MATTVGQHGVAAFISPSNGDALDATVVKGNDNTLRSSYVDHDSDPGIHVQSSTTALRPAAGEVGRKWMTYDGTSARLWYDDGTTWQEINYMSTTPGATTFGGNVTINGTGGTALTVNGSMGATVQVSAPSMTVGTSFTASNSNQYSAFARWGSTNQTTASDWSGTITRELRAIQHVRLTGNTTVTLSNTMFDGALQPSAFSVCFIKQDGTGGRTLAFSNVLFPGGTTPTQTATANKGDLWLFVALDQSSFYGVRLGANL